jgi:hypothetical protein
MKLRNHFLVLCLIAVTHTPGFSQSDSLLQSTQADSVHRWQSLGITFSNFGQIFPGFEDLNGHNFSSPFVNIVSYTSHIQAKAFTLAATGEYSVRNHLNVYGSAGYRFWRYSNGADENGVRSHWDYSQNIYFAELGLKKNVLNKKAYTIHAGLGAVLLLRTGMQSISSDQYYDATGAVFSGTQYQYSGDDAFAAGLNGRLGIDFRLCHKLFLGLDITQAFLYSKIYGKETEQVSFINSSRNTLNYSVATRFSQATFAPATLAFNLSWHL